MKTRTRRLDPHGGDEPRWDKPAAQKRLDELAKEQGLGDQIPDYAALAEKVWPTRKDVEEFDAWFSEIRRKGAARDLDD